jgi:hypothetical protein
LLPDSHESINPQLPRKNTYLHEAISSGLMNSDIASHQLFPHKSHDHQEILVAELRTAAFR